MNSVMFMLLAVPLSFIIPSKTQEFDKLAGETLKVEVIEWKLK